MTSQTRKVTHVAAGILINADGQFLLGSRPAGKPYAGYWEFPGGKLEQGESAQDALCRELNEEMGIQVKQATPWLTQRFNYPHADVEIHFFKVTAWDGDIHGQEGQALSWQTVGRLNTSPILPANGPILRSLALPTQISISNVAELGLDNFLKQLSEKWANEAAWVLIREPQLPANEYAHLVQSVQKIARPHGGKIIIHRDIELARQLLIDSIHLTSNQLATLSERPSGMDWVSASTHHLADLQQVDRLGLDFAFLGHVNSSQSHPTETPLGWNAFAALCQHGWRFPIFAIGGQNQTTLSTAQQHGGHGVAILRAAWQAGLAA
ncbi:MULTISPECIES: Nudix family hydrolase [Deefgea]|uniref:8-oxo-dGTP diphosphatase n=1 Tax=Deefgea chitinilytica TaxID=570276 RepID=A0ABS2C8W5_9NEIS|nr:MULTISPECIES: Nudix family hydrolase [Deefgea]MBM5570596.1 Nudix family hydrolase [Deefgea chitinilytica]MBM9887825.1 Nudix family hydrolase [Deefgea sp. CFH1-16]